MGCGREGLNQAADVVGGKKREQVEGLASAKGQLARERWGRAGWVGEGEGCNGVEGVEA